MTDESRLAHYCTCQHRYGAGCGCECCAWAGEAVRLAAEAVRAVPVLDDVDTFDERVAREAVQAALPVIRAAAVAAERERLALAMLGCQVCGKIHTPHNTGETAWDLKPYAPSMASPDDGHSYRPRSPGTRERIASLLRATDG